LTQRLVTPAPVAPTTGRTFQALIGFFTALQRLSDLDRPDDLALGPGLRESAQSDD
jgi:glycosyltransferase A (GT-A) superfamily protein (DUF2064 family)